MITAVITMLIGFRASDVSWTLLRILTYCLMLFGGFLLFSALFLIEATCSFFVIGNVAVFNVLTYGAKSTRKIPVRCLRQRYHDLLHLSDSIYSRAILSAAVPARAHRQSALYFCTVWCSPFCSACPTLLELWRKALQILRFLIATMFSGICASAHP